MFRRSAFVSVPIVLGALSYRNLSFNAESWPFDTKGFPTTISASVVKVPSAANDLKLAGVGMRRKNLYITEVDVYLVGVNLSAKALNRAQEWNATKKADVSLATYLTQEAAAGKKAPTDTAVSATLRFCRNITKDQFLTAFDESFKGCTPEAVASFKSSMSNVMSNGAVGPKDELVLFWLDNGDMAFTLNGVLGEKLTNFELNKRLLEVYIDPTRTVSKELYACIEKHINDVTA